MQRITITLAQTASGTWEAQASSSARLVCGNSDGVLSLTDIDSKWNLSGKPRTATVTAVSLEGDEETTELTDTRSTIDLPVIRNAYLLRVHLSGGGHQTAIPALIHCEACITDAGGTAAQRTPDIYNLAVEYLAARLHGEAGADAIMAEIAARRESLGADFPGSAYRLAAQAPERVTQITGTLSVDGQETPITPDSIVSDSLSTSWTAMQSDFLLPGGVPTTELRCTLRTSAAPEELYGADIALDYSILRREIVAAGDWITVPLGTFTVAEAAADSEAGVTITAYDGMAKLDRIPRESLPFASGTAYTPAEIITVIAAQAELPFSDPLPDTLPASWAFFVANADTSIATARDLLSCTVQIIGCIAYVDRFGALRLRRVAESDPVAAFDADQRTASKVSRLPYRLYRLDTTVADSAGDGTRAVVQMSINTLWPDGVAAELPENPLWATIDGDTLTRARQCLGILTRALDPVAYSPGETTVAGDPTIDPLDWITVGGVSMPVTASDWHYRGGQTLTAAGAEAVAGIARSQAEKAALAERQATAEGLDNMARAQHLAIIQASGHRGMALHDHIWLAHFTHGELAGEEDT